MKTFAIGIAVGASLLSTTALAAGQRPTYLAFKAPVATAASNAGTPAAPRVKKRDGAIGPIPLVVPLVGGVIALGLVAGLTTGGNGSPG